MVARPGLIILSSAPLPCPPLDLELWPLSFVEATLQGRAEDPALAACPLSAGTRDWAPFRCFFVFSVRVGG